MVNYNFLELWSCSISHWPELKESQCFRLGNLDRHMIDTCDRQTIVGLFIWFMIYTMASSLLCY